MPMVPFYTIYGEDAFREMRSIHLRGNVYWPDGEYGFLELFCDEKDCDCRRVIIQVLSAEEDNRVVATIGYGWESVNYYKNWIHGSRIEEAKACKGPTLEPFAPFDEHAIVFLDLFKAMICDKSYVARLEKHYKIFRQAIDSGIDPLAVWQSKTSKEVNQKKRSTGYEMRVKKVGGKEKLDGEKASEIFLKYADPLLEELPDNVPANDLQKALFLPMCVWNAVTMNTKAKGKNYVKMMMDSLDAIQSPAEKALSVGVITAMANRRQEEFGKEKWAIGDLQVYKHHDGDLRVRVIAVMPKKNKKCVLPGWWNGDYKNDML